MRTRFSLILALLILFVPLTAAPEAGKRRIFYVRQTIGEDVNDGLLPETAWRSLSMLENTVQAGDTAYIGPGLYREKVTVGSSGTAEMRIAFIADTTGEHTGDPPGVVMITGADPIDEGLFVPEPAPGLYMAPSPEGPVRGVVEMDGPQYRYATARSTTEHREGMSELDVVAKLPASFFYDSDAKIVHIHTSDGKPPSTHELELIRRTDGIATNEQSYVTVVGFTFRHMQTAGINFQQGSRNCIAINNTSYGSWQGIRVLNSTDVLILGNTLFRNDNSGAYFFAASTQGYAVGNVAYENSKGFRWSSDSASGLALNNLAFDNLETGISIENADDIRVSQNVLANNAIAQLRVNKSRYTSQANCFESRDAEQLIALIDRHKRYNTLAGYRKATNQDLGSREVCGGLPEKVDVRKLHAETMAYAEHARKTLARGEKTSR